MAPFKAMTKDTMKKAKATMPMASRHESPMEMMPAANCHVAALKASDTQYARKEVTPHLRACFGTGSRSLFVLTRELDGGLTAPGALVL